MLEPLECRPLKLIWLLMMELPIDKVGLRATASPEGKPLNQLTIISDLTTFLGLLRFEFKTHYNECRKVNQSISPR